MYCLIADDYLGRGIMLMSVVDLSPHKTTTPSNSHMYLLYEHWPGLL